MIRVFFLLVLVSCTTDPEYSYDREDYSLEDDFSLDDLIAEEDYYERLEKSNKAIPFRSSMPSSFAVGSRYRLFNGIPKTAKPPRPSRIGVTLGACQLFLETGPILVTRFLYSNSWIKFGELTAFASMKLEAKIDLNLQMSTQLKVIIPKRFQSTCRSLLFGRKVPVGQFNMHLSRASLIASPGTERRGFRRIAPDTKPENIFLYWYNHSSSPVARNDLDFPAVVYSSFYRSIMPRRGFYYVSFQPILQKSDKRQPGRRLPRPVRR